MTLKAVLFDFKGVIINDELLHEQLIEQVLLEENLLLKPGEYHEFCLGKSDRACLKDILRCSNVPLRVTRVLVLVTAIHGEYSIHKRYLLNSCKAFNYF